MKTLVAHEILKTVRHDGLTISITFLKYKRGETLRSYTALVVDAERTTADKSSGYKRGVPNRIYKGVVAYPRGYYGKEEEEGRRLADVCNEIRSYECLIFVNQVERRPWDLLRGKGKENPREES